MNPKYIKILGLSLAGIAPALSASAQLLYNNGTTLYVNTSGTIQVNGDMTNATGSDFSNNGTVTVTGTLTNNQVMASGANGTLTFNGSAAQTLNGSSAFLAKDVVINNAAGVTLNTPLKVSGSVTFTTGDVVAATSATPVIFTSTGNYTGASNSSHVNGYVVKEGTGAFSYPVGNGTNLQKVDVNLSANATGMQVRYVVGNAGSGTYATTGSESTPLAVYNTGEYWDLSPLTTATGAVTVFWDNVHNITVNSLPSLRVAHKSGANWLNEGGNSITGNTGAGSVTSNSISTWSPFTLGATSPTALPVHLLSFTAKHAGSNNQLDWNTASEDAQIHYDIERSSNAQQFSTIGSVSGKEGTGNSYQFLDAQPLAANYYRLRISEPGSAVAYSNVVLLRQEGKGSLSVSPVPARDQITVTNSNPELKGQNARVCDLQGRVVTQFTIQEKVNLSTAQWAAGMYLLHLPDGSTLKIVKD
ncbi:hypothetical protein DBR32_07095 [Taibaiella sp. KBW10]|uniref:T9SS type A sorting domain-containing protein n=1 Tax=Taibaiella sp. KBW10 TaxID=2153357 RepID=UPI000F5A2EFD|nr:T9SS type A sorting domain-containing protein [Taibaiella sp. KBW10]RQO31705.1 hypothetical protein DBR32_07095 [Taibaiella sp. KBW10]